MEEELRTRTNVDALIGAKIATIEEGKELMAEVDKWNKQLLHEMVEKDLNNADQKAYSDVRYDLKTAKQRIGAQLTNLVKAKIAKRK